MRYQNRIFHWTTLGEEIAYSLRINIINGTIPSGTQLSENQLAKEFGTSRSPIRDALKALSSEGLIRLERMGAIVLDLDAKNLIELYETRHLIESFALKKLTSSLSNYQHVLRDLEKTIDSMELAAKYKDYEEFTHFDFLFHETFITGIQHNRIKQMWESMKYVVHAVLLITTEKRFMREEDPKVKLIVDKHRLITQSLRQGDVHKIEEMLNEHYQHTYASIDLLTKELKVKENS
jgi:GntR family transcriptional regulator, gluconate operon transcriptional repressor